MIQRRMLWLVHFIIWIFKQNWFKKWSLTHWVEFTLQESLKTNDLILQYSVSAAKTLSPADTYPFKCFVLVKVHIINHTMLWRSEELLRVPMRALMCSLCCNNGSWRRGFRPRSLTAHRPGPMTTVYFCWAPAFIFIRVLMSILICLLCDFRWVTRECVGTCENSLCLCLGWRDACTTARGCKCVYVRIGLKTHTRMIMKASVSCRVERLVSLSEVDNNSTGWE